MPAAMPLFANALFVRLNPTWQGKHSPRSPSAIPVPRFLAALIQSGFGAAIGSGTQTRPCAADDSRRICSGYPELAAGLAAEQREPPGRLRIANTASTSTAA